MTNLAFLESARAEKIEILEKLFELPVIERMVDICGKSVSEEPVAKLFGTPLITPLKSRQCI